MYKNMMYDTPPIKHYEEYKTDKVGNHVLIYIRKAPSNNIHIIILYILLALFIFMNCIYNIYIINNSNDFIISVPAEMYYNTKLDLLELDVYNNINNVNDVEIRIIINNEEFTVCSISPGEYVGTIRVDSTYFTKFPMNAVIRCVPYNDNVVYDSFDLNITIFSRDIV